MSKNLTILLLVTALLGSTARTAVANDNSDSSDILEIASSIKLTLGSDSLSITLKNSSDRAACIPSSEFDPTKNNAVIVDGEGKTMERQFDSTGPMVDFHGINAADPIYMLFPGTPVRFDYDLDPYALHPGVYKFKLELPYYVCRKVVALESLKPSEEWLRARGVTVTGSFRVLPNN